ncbi:MAG: site-specific integrase [Clostridium sp.]|nr:site-specific integrase [Clostridium sp.]
MTATARLSTGHGLDQFQKHLTTHNKSPNTICVYRYAVEQFYKLYPQLTPRNLQLYKVYLLEHYKPKTVNLRIRALNCYMEYRHTAIPPVTMIKIQQKTYLDKIISQADYEYLKRRLVENEDYNYYFMVRLITATGVRVSELVTFEVEDAFRGHKDIYSKGNKMRRVYIPRLLITELQKWLKAARRSTGPLFLNRFGSPISPSGIRAQFKVLAARYNLDPEVMYPHSFRHRFAKNFIEKCGDISLLSDLLGHESIETTRIYLRRSSSEQYRIVNKVVDW